MATKPSCAVGLVVGEDVEPSVGSAVGRTVGEDEGAGVGETVGAVVGLAWDCILIFYITGVRIIAYQYVRADSRCELAVWSQCESRSAYT